MRNFWNFLEFFGIFFSSLQKHLRNLLSLHNLHTQYSKITYIDKQEKITSILDSSSAILRETFTPHPPPLKKWMEKVEKSSKS